MRYDIYRDGTIALQAFKAGQYDIRRELVEILPPYDSPAMHQGLIKKR